MYLFTVNVAYVSGILKLEFLQHKVLFISVIIPSLIQFLEVLVQRNLKFINYY